MDDSFYTKYQVTFLPGLAGGGEALTGIRKTGIFTPSSLLSKYGVKNTTKTLKDHWDNLAKSILENANGRNIIIFAHSAGHFDLIKILPLISKNASVFPILISPPGASLDKIRGIKVLNRLNKTVNDVAFYEQHFCCPPPPLLIGNDRYQLMTNFITKILNKHDLHLELNKIDSILENETDPIIRQEMLRKRALILHYPIQQLFLGKQYSKKEHAVHLNMNHDIVNKKSLILQGQFLFFIIKTLFIGFNSIFIDSLLKSKVNRIVLLKLGFDTLVTPHEIINLEQEIKKNNIEVSTVEMNNFAHSTVGYVEYFDKKFFSDLIKKSLNSR